MSACLFTSPLTSTCCSVPWKADSSRSAFYGADMKADFVAKFCIWEGKINYPHHPQWKRHFSFFNKMEMWCSRCGAVVWFSLGRWCNSMKNNIILSSILSFFLILYFLIWLHSIIDMHLKCIEKLESFHWKKETVEFWCHRYKDVIRGDADCEVVQLDREGAA